MEKFFLESLAIYFLFCYNGDMRTVYETEKLRRLLTIFCDLTEITITLFDSNMTSIIDVNAGEWKNYCLAIGDDETRLKLCKQCDAQHAEEARKKKDIVIYACHAGIAEAVVPIYTENTLVAYLMIGKFRDVDQRLSPPELVIQKAEAFHLDKDKMLKCWEELPLIDSKKMSNAIDLLQLITNEIINGKLIHAAKTAWADRITAYIQKHIGETITIETLCAVTQLKRHELYDHFKRYFNLSPKAYIDQQKLIKAKELLTTTQLPIGKISEVLGFYKEDVFSKFFKEKMGMGVTPMQYRKQKRLQPD